ncbi:indole-2-monooxygenase-like isoform X1 [Triticum urartu]|uniref:indole-2-monooxygenase-like isoform X1 n=1 Tax=Triticum urartu TaxID=4572 RepID=UPI00204333FF|nr:indole-2-monooxygenase-like isoform X1 [Triticum urartu]
MVDLLQKLLPETLPRAWLFLFLFCLIVSVQYWFTGKFGAKRQRLPPSPPALPIIGHVHLIGSLPHISLSGLAGKHGLDVMLLRLQGTVPNLVVSSSSTAEAVLRTHDHVLASRPYSVVSDTIMYRSSVIGFAPYGEYWRQARKLVTTHMLSAKKVQSFRGAAAEEVSMAMAKINQAAATDAAVDMSELLHTFANDMACRIVWGKFFLKDGQSKLFGELIKDTSRLLGGFNLEEYFPAVGRVGVLKKAVCAKAERVRNRWADLLDKVIDDHDVFFGAIDTSANALEFTLAELMKKPHLMVKLQDEVRGIVPQRQEIIYETNMNNMTYLRAVIKESLRLHPLAPLLAPHLAMADCIIDGYTVPAGTRVVVNAWAIGRDPSPWEYAEEFIPERFTDEGSSMHVNFKGNDFQFLPFGARRRMCPGMNLGVANAELMLANIVCHFDWELPPGVERKDIDMTEVFGLTVRRKEKLLLIPKSRM